MRTVLLALPLILLALPASAQGRPDSLAMSCASVQQLVKRAGDIVIWSGPNIFDRYVSNASHCAVTQVTRPAWLRSADNPQCFAGYQCRDRLRVGGSR